MPLLFSIVLKISARTIRQERKKEIKLSVSADDIIVHTENPKDSIKKPLEITYTFSKVVAYKINIQEYTVFIY